MKYIAWLFLTSVLPLPDDLRHVFRFFLLYFILYRQLSVVKTTLSLQLYFDSNTGLVLRWNLSSFWEELCDMRLHSLQERERDYGLWNPMLYHPEKKTNGCSHFLTIQRCVYYSKYFSLSKGDQLWFVVFFVTKVDRSSLLRVLHLLSSSWLNTTNIHRPESYKTQAGRDYILLTELMHKVELLVCFKFWE